MIPEHDRKWNGQPNETIISHYDMSVWHGLLNLEVKFFWRHLITDKLVAEIKGLVRKMDSSDCHTGPRLILMGETVCDSLHLHLQCILVSQPHISHQCYAS